MHHPFVFFPLALVALGVVACGGGNREAESPTTAVVAAAPAPAPVAAATPRPTQLEPAPVMAPAPEGPLQAKQGVATEEGDPGDGTMAATAQVEAEANAAQLTKDKAKWEKLGRDQERKATDIDARERLARSSARVAQTQNQLSRVPAARRGKYNTDMVTFGSKKTEVQTRIAGISAYGSDEWKRMRVELDTALNELDAAATRVEGDLF